MVALFVVLYVLAFVGWGWFAFQRGSRDAPMPNFTIKPPPRTGAIPPSLKPSPSLGRARAIAVDFDGCLCTNVWPGIGEPNTELIDALIAERNNGSELILWTCRESELLDQAVEWCSEYGLEFDAVNENLPGWKQRFGNDPRKVGADCYIDDKAVRRVADRRTKETEERL